MSSTTLVLQAKPKCGQSSPHDVSTNFDSCKKLLGNERLNDGNQR